MREKKSDGFCNSDMINLWVYKINPVFLMGLFPVADRVFLPLMGKRQCTLTCSWPPPAYPGQPQISFLRSMTWIKILSLLTAEACPQAQTL